MSSGGGMRGMVAWSSPIPSSGPSPPVSPPSISRHGVKGEDGQDAHRQPHAKSSGINASAANPLLHLPMQPISLSATMMPAGGGCTAVL